MPQVIDNLKDFYINFSPDSLLELDEIYADNIVFMDPLHRVQGMEELKAYFKASMEGLEACRFEFERQLESDGEAFLEWRMLYRHPRLRGGKELILNGSSVVQFDDKITHHRDYYDAGQMLYEHIPVVSSVIRYVKRKVAS